MVKTVILPWFLTWAIREAAVRREIEPLIGFSASLALGAVAVALSFGIAQHIPLPESDSTLLIPVALSTVMIGLIVLTTRSKALSQVVGYLMLENGIYVFGLTQAERVPFLVELGVLLDVFVGVFIMGIVVFHINREFDSLDSSPADRTEGLMPLLVLILLPAAAAGAAYLVGPVRLRSGSWSAPRRCTWDWSARLWSVPAITSVRRLARDRCAGSHGAYAGERAVPRGRGLRRRVPPAPNPRAAAASSSPACSGSSPRRRWSRSATIWRCCGSGWRRRRWRWRRWSTIATTAAPSRRSGSTSCSRRSASRSRCWARSSSRLRRRWGHPLLLEDLVAARDQPPPGSAPGRVRVPARGVRHQDGAGAAARLEARHLRRGAQPGRRPHGRRAHQLRVPRGRAHHPGHDRRRPRGVRPAARCSRSAWSRWSWRRRS